MYRYLFRGSLFAYILVCIFCLYSYQMYLDTWVVKECLARNCWALSGRNLKNIKLMALSYLHKKFEPFRADSMSPRFPWEPRLLCFSLVLLLSMDSLVQSLQNSCPFIQMFIQILNWKKVKEKMQKEGPCESDPVNKLSQNLRIFPVM